MKVNGKQYRTIWLKPGNAQIVQIIDQRRLPHEFVTEDLRTVEEVAAAIKDMHVRGAPLIGAAAAYGMYLAAHAAPRASFDTFIAEAGAMLIRTRPTAVNLAWAVKRQLAALGGDIPYDKKLQTAFETAQAIADEDAQNCRRIGEHGLALIEAIARRKHGAAVNVLTHCNAGWLAAVDYGTATAPIYAAHTKGIKLHVWVDETRPRNQGAKLTAWELLQEGVPHSVIADNTGGHLMQHGLVDLVIVGSDRTTRTGDIANKIGTYLKALAAKDNNVPFYAALPSSSIDWKMRDGVAEIPIEERDAEEVRFAEGLCGGEVKSVLVPPHDSPAVNFAFDVTPARLVTALITERGVCEANEQALTQIFPGLSRA